jgi:glycosyltransferase involved in cell wall biosynthesis
VLYVCIPVYNEAPTIGVLLWRIRKVFQEYSREYEVLVYDDGSTDATAETLAPYAKVMPLTVITGGERRGYAAAVDALCRAASRRTKYPRRDAMVLMQGDFTDQPEHLPELIKRFEGGADVVVVEREEPVAGAPAAPIAVKRLRLAAPWVLRAFLRVPGVRDPFGSFRLLRISVVKDLVRASGDDPVAVGDGWAANVDLLANAAPFARRVETLPLPSRYDVRERESRVRPMSDAVSLFHFARRSRSRVRPQPAPPAVRPSGPPAAPPTVQPPAAV